MSDLDAMDVRAECSNIIAGFAAHVDNRRFAEAVALFAPDGIFERPDLTARGHGEIAGLWADRPASFKTRHLCHQTWFEEINADLVRTVTAFTLYQTSHDGEGLPSVPAPIAIAEFHDEFRRFDGAWRIAHRRSVPAMFG
ncbi:MAG: nuclear transport factor 2 family protein [Candidatus Sphingomonas colombiensis]|nr:nuclear transport factor 2 family protein [Sphingomonas sp.]WEK42221.1 MAG: nuclear transport factor 2 family protein [Sphingomonas sp.]